MSRGTSSTATTPRTLTTLVASPADNRQSDAIEVIIPDTTLSRTELSIDVLDILKHSQQSAQITDRSTQLSATIFILTLLFESAAYLVDVTVYDSKTTNTAVSAISTLNPYLVTTLANIEIIATAAQMILFGVAARKAYLNRQTVLEGKEALAEAREFLQRNGCLAFLDRDEIKQKLERYTEKSDANPCEFSNNPHHYSANLTQEGVVLALEEMDVLLKKEAIINGSFENQAGKTADILFKFIHDHPASRKYILGEIGLVEASELSSELFKTNMLEELKGNPTCDALENLLSTIGKTLKDASVQSPGGYPLEIYKSLINGNEKMLADIHAFLKKEYYFKRLNVNQIKTMLPESSTKYPDVQEYSNLIERLTLVETAHIFETIRRERHQNSSADQTQWSNFKIWGNFSLLITPLAIAAYAKAIAFSNGITDGLNKPSMQVVFMMMVAMTMAILARLIYDQGSKMKIAPVLPNFFEKAKEQYRKIFYDHLSQESDVLADPLLPDERGQHVSQVIGRHDQEAASATYLAPVLAPKGCV